MKVHWKSLLDRKWEKFWHPSCDYKAKTAGGWHEWELKKRSAKFAYFMSDTIPDAIDSVFVYPVSRLKNRIKTWWQGTPTIKIRGLEKGYHDADQKMLYGNFQLLVDYVEQECAYMNIWSHSEYKYPNWFIRTFTDWRDAGMGLKYVIWGANLDNPNMCDTDNIHLNVRQAESNKEVLKLYNWWVNIRPNRLDEMDASGYSDYYNKRRAAQEEKDGFRSIWAGFESDHSDELQHVLAESHRIEQKYADEDDEMLTRLIKVRHDMWT